MDSETTRFQEKLSLWNRHSQNVNGECKANTSTLHELQINADNKMGLASILKLLWTTARGTGEVETLVFLLGGVECTMPRNSSPE